MKVLKAFNKGWELYKKNFSALLLLNALRVFAIIAFTLVAVILAIPFVISGLGPFVETPELLLTTPGLLEAAAYMVSYLIALAALSILVLPVFFYPHLAGSVVALRKPVKLESALSLLKTNYLRLVLDTVIYWAIVMFLTVESMFLLIAAPVLGVALFLVSTYVSVRLTFWDVLVFKGEKHPLMASWKLTKGKFWDSLAFVAAANLISMACFAFLNLGVVLCFFVAPLVTTSKAVFVSGMGKGFNKKRLKK